MNYPAQSGVCELLGAVGLRSTAASRALMVLFEQERDAMLTHAQIDDLLRQGQVHVSKVTVYRLLDRFVATGLLRRVVDQHRVSRYGREHEKGSALRIHPRFECRQCHRLCQLAELPADLHEALRQVFVRWEAQGHQGSEADVAIHGVCARCVPH